MFLSEPIDAWNRVYGNIAFKIDDFLLEIRNETTCIEYFSGKEDVAKFSVSVLSSGFKPISGEFVEKNEIKSRIEDVIVIRDEVFVSVSSGKTSFGIAIDDGIVIKTENIFLIVCQDWHLMEMIRILFSNDYRRDMRSVSEVEADFSGSEANRYSAVCKRSEILLKHVQGA